MADMAEPANPVAFCTNELTNQVDLRSGPLTNMWSMRQIQAKMIRSNRRPSVTDDARRMSIRGGAILGVRFLFLYIGSLS